MNNFDFEANYVLGLYADAKGYASIRLKQKYNDNGLCEYTIMHENYSKVVSVKNIKESLEFKNSYNKPHYYYDVFINNLPSLEKIVGYTCSPKMIEINQHDRIFLTTCLFNDKILTIQDEFKESIIDNLNSYNPSDENINHRVMALFLALEAYIVGSWLY